MRSESPRERVESLVLPTAAIRRIDVQAIEQFQMHSLVLMENAALGCVRWLNEKFASDERSAPRTTILCGRGNNGGDGLVIARHLRAQGWYCDVIQLGPLQKLAPDARHNFDALTTNAIHIESFGANYVVDSESSGDNHAALAHLPQAELIIDAMLGTGITGPPRPPLDTWIEAANQSEALKVAIDVPSGIDADSGDASQPAFVADVTLTFVARKPAMAAAEHQHKFGDCHVLPIGLSAQQLHRLWMESEREN